MPRLAQVTTLIVLLSVCTFTIAQKPVRKPSPPIAVESSTETLPRGSWGDEALGSLFDALLPLAGLDKSQFETTEEYASRLDNESRGIGVERGRLYAFAFTNNPYTYDADLQQYQPAKYGVVCLWTRPAHPSQKPCFFRVIRIKESKFVGSNAFGVRTTVTRREGLQIELTVSNAEGLAVKLGGGALGYTGPSFPYELALARTLMNESVQMVLLASFDDLRMHKKVGSIASATIDMPVEIKHDAYVMRIKAQALWFVASPSGRVLHKLSIE